MVHMARTTTPLNRDVSRAIDLILEAVDKNQADLAELIGVNPSNVSRRMKSGAWRLEELDAICRTVGAPITVLFDRRALAAFLAGRAFPDPDDGGGSVHPFPPATSPDLGESPIKWYAAA